MRSLEKNNRNPRNGIEFEPLAKLLLESNNGIASTDAIVGVGPRRVAQFRRVGHDDPQAIVVWLDGEVVATLFDDQSVKVGDAARTSLTVRHTADWCLLGIGFRFMKIGRTFKVYEIKTGQYRDWHPGMVIREGVTSVGRDSH